MTQSVRSRSLGSRRAARLALAGLAALGALSAALSVGCGAAPPSSGQDTGGKASAGQQSTSGGTGSAAAAGSYAIAGQSSGGAGAGNASGGAGGTTAIAGFTGSGGASAGSSGSGGASAGAGASTGGSAGGSSGLGCAGKTYKLCEDFETGTVGALPTGWTKFNGYGTSSAQDQALASDQFHSGSMALKSMSGSSGASRIQKSIASLGATASKHWGRIFYKIQSPVARDPAGNLIHFTWVSLMGTSENRVVDIVQAGGANGKHQWLFNNPDDKGSLGSPYDYAFDAAWHCAEWYVDVSTKSYRFFSDSTEVKSIAFTNKADSEMSNYTSIIVGVTYYQSTKLAPPYTEWFDDLAIDDTQIGCQ